MLTPQLVTILDTTDLIEAMEHALGCQLIEDDQLELFQQMFQLLDGHSPEDLVGRPLLVYSSFVFANHLTLNHATVDCLAHRILTQLWERIGQQSFYTGGVLMWFPFSMNGKDLCVRRYNS